MNKLGNKESWKILTSEFHMETRAFQLSLSNDNIFSFTSQVPVALCSSNVTILDDKGQREIYDYSGKDKDVKQLYTLNVYDPMKL